MSAVTCHSLPVLIRYWCGRARPPARAKAGVYFCTRGDPSKLGSRLRGGGTIFYYAQLPTQHQASMITFNALVSAACSNVS